MYLKKNTVQYPPASSSYPQEPLPKTSTTMNTPTLQTPNNIFHSPVKCITLFSHNYNQKNKKHTPPHRIIFPRKNYWRCEAAKSPPPPRQPRSTKPDPNYEKGVNPVGFLTKFNISDKPFAQFLRER